MKAPISRPTRPTTRLSAPAPSCSRNGRRARSSAWSRTRTTTSRASPISTRSTGSHSRRRRAFGRVRNRQGRRAARRLGGEFRRAAAEQAQEHLRHRRRLGVLQPAFLALAQQPLGPDREQEIPSGADVCDRSQHGQGRGLERPRQGRDRPVGLGDQVLHRRGAEIRLRSGQGQGAAEGSRLQRREAPHAASALWRDMAALGRNG